jgi:peptidyl-dipeptidase Dcp
MSALDDPSPLPFQAPPFDELTDADYEPAILEGMKRQLSEISAIAENAEAPTFDNTLVPMERSGELLTRASRVFFAMAHANTNDTLQAIKARLAPELAAHDDAIYLNAKLFARVRAVHDARGSLEREAAWLVTRYMSSFIHAGAELSLADQTALRALNKEASSLSAEFERRLLAASKASALVVDDVTDLAGGTPGDLASAALAAKGRGAEGKWALALQNTTQQPAQAWLAKRATRERLWRASLGRCEKGDDNDTRALVQRLAELRAEKAKLLGFPTYAAYALSDQMARTPAAAVELLARVAAPALAKAREEAARMQALVDEGGGERFELAPWDWQFMAEAIRKKEYAVDDEEVRPYLELGRVLRDGAFFAAEKLYGLTFEERRDLPVYHPDVRVFDVKDDGEPLGLFYADHFERDNKAGGAWMSSFVEQSGLLGARPVVYNVCNFQKPAPGQPALLSFDDVRTLFHEFGHALHGLLSDAKYPSLAGTNVPRDFVEFPSQFNEHWATEPAVFASYAKHHATGAPMPAALVAKIERARKYGQGFATTEYLAAALLDMEWHTLPAGAPREDVEAFEARSLERHGVALALVPPRYRTSYFAHIWGGGYAASYYAYLWAEVLDHDAYRWFSEHGGMTRANGQRFREMILSRGHTEELGSLYRAFRGRDPSVEALLDERGLASR